MFLSLLSIVKGLLFFTGSYSNNVFLQPLSSDEEEYYIKEMESGNKEARNNLIEHNLRLVAHIVKKYEGKERDTDDLISIGTIGLIKGIDSFKSDKNIRITTYVARCIENEILMHFRSNNKYDNDISLNDYIGLDKDGNEISLIDVLPNNEMDTDTLVINNDEKNELFKNLDVLNERERNIIIKRYGLFGYNELTQKDIANKMNISRSYVSRIEKRALTKLFREFYNNNKKTTK